MNIAFSERTEAIEPSLTKLAIETRELRKVYGEGTTEVIAMKDASVSVRQGEVVALLGPSGSGKSTFLTAIGLINPPTSGQIWIGGELVLDGPDAQTDVRAFRRKHIGFVFQKSNLIDFLNARENVQIAMELNGLSHRAAGKRAQELLDSLGVGDRANHEVSMLSGGQQQRRTTMLLWGIQFQCLFSFHGLARRFRGWNCRGRRRSEEYALYHHHQKQEASDPHPWANFAS